MDSSGPNSGSTFDGDSGGYLWANAGNVAASDNARATATPADAGEITDPLLVTGFGFAIPVDSAILGIVLKIERSSNFASDISDSTIQLLDAGVAVGVNKASTTFWPSNTDAVATYGGANDQWGRAWNAAEINATDFGVSVSASSAFGGYSAKIDHITLTVYYLRGPFGRSRRGAMGRLHQRG